MKPGFEQQSERVWVVLDGVGQPCLRLMIHRQDGLPPHAVEIPDDLDSAYGPYSVHAYRLVPEPLQAILEEA